MAFDIVTVIRGYHVYQRIWTPFVGETATIASEINNAHDQYAITVLEDNTLCTVGHLPMEMSRECYYFIRRVSVEVTGPRQKSVTEGKGMEIPCITHLATSSHIYIYMYLNTMMTRLC